MAETAEFVDYLNPLAITNNMFGILFCGNFNWTKYLISILRIAFFTAYTGSSLIGMSDTFRGPLLSTVEKTSMVLPLVICVAWSNLKTVYYYAQRNKYNDLIQEVNLLSAMNLVEYKRKSIYTRVIIWSAIVITYQAVEIWWLQSIVDIAYSFAFGFAIFTSALESLMMICVLEELGLVFDHVNHVLSKPIPFTKQRLDNLLPRSQKKLISPGRSNHLLTIKAKDKKSYLDAIFEIIDLHYRTVQLSKKVNVIFTYPLLGIIGLGLMFLVKCGETAVYLIFMAYTFWQPFRGHEFAVNTFWTLFELLHLFFLIRAWFVLSEKAKLASTHVHEIWNELAMNDEVDCNVSHLQLISVQLLNNKLKFTANGFFAIDLSLFQMILKAVSTYIVILMQFEMSAAKKQYKVDRF